MRPVIAISVGCPSGIGPEVAVRAAAAVRTGVVLVGDRWVIERAAKLVGVSSRRLLGVDDRMIASGLPVPPSTIACYAPAEPVGRRSAPFGKPTREAGRAQLSWIDQATDLVSSGKAQALVTGPVSKLAIASSGPRAARFRGHTEYLAERVGARRAVMAFWAEELTISLVTTHLPIARVAKALTPEAVGTAAYLTAEFVHRLKKKKVRLAIAGLNPHAGEGGLLGTEEVSCISPGIADARRRLVRARLPAVLEGPMGAETAVRYARAGQFDAVVAMYHDQATIPMKLVGFGEAVNVTLGLPIIRTSVDHGTGYDIAGKGKADARGMKAAIRLGVQLARSA